MSSNFKTIEEALQAVLDKKPLQYSRGEYSDIGVHPLTGIEGIIDLMHNTHWSNFRVKPKTKTLTYQTRLYKASKSDKIFIWSSLGNGEQESFEKLGFFSEWLETAQEHTLEYEE